MDLIKVVKKEFIDNESEFYFISGLLLSYLANEFKLQKGVIVTNLLERTLASKGKLFKKNLGNHITHYLPQMHVGGYLRVCLAKFFDYDPECENMKTFRKFEYEDRLLSGFMRSDSIIKKLGEEWLEPNMFSRQ